MVRYSACDSCYISFGVRCICQCRCYSCALCRGFAGTCLNQVDNPSDNNLATVVQCARVAHFEQLHTVTLFFWYVCKSHSHYSCSTAHQSLVRFASIAFADVAGFASWLDEFEAFLCQLQIIRGLVGKSSRPCLHTPIGAFASLPKKSVTYTVRTVLP